MAQPFDDGLSVTRILSQRPTPDSPDDKPWWRCLPRVILLLLLAVACQQFSQAQFPDLDERASVYFLESSQKAVVSYAMVRSANAVVSVVQESELLISPTGVGMSIAVGQVLDPLNDMLERTSDVLVFALISIGVQRASLEISQENALLLAALAFALAALSACFPARPKGVQYWLVRLAVIFVLLRLMLPASSVVFDESYQRLFAPRIEQAQEVLRLVPGTSALNIQSSTTAQSGLLDKLLPDGLRQHLDEASKQMEWMKQTFAVVVRHAGELIQALLDLVAAYIAIFILQVVILPIAALWLILTASHLLASRWLGTTHEENSNA